MHDVRLLTHRHIFKRVLRLLTCVAVHTLRLPFHVLAEGWVEVLDAGNFVGSWGIFISRHLKTGLPFEFLCSRCREVLACAGREQWMWLIVVRLRSRHVSLVGREFLRSTSFPLSLLVNLGFTSSSEDCRHDFT